MSQTEMDELERELDRDAEIGSGDFVDRRPVRPPLRHPRKLPRPVTPSDIEPLQPPKRSYPIAWAICFVQLAIVVLLMGILYVTVNTRNGVDKLSTCLASQKLNFTPCAD